MARTVAIGMQDFEKIIREACFYIDKTEFIRQWWESRDEVTLLARPRRFGKTLNMSMLEIFFLTVIRTEGTYLKVCRSGSTRNTGSCREPIR